MPSDPIFRSMKPAVLSQIAAYLRWDPLVSTSPAKLLSQIGEAESFAWLNTHREELEQQISWAGTPIFSYALGNRKSYREIVGDLAVQVGALVPSGADIAAAETLLLEKLWSDTLSRLSDEERAELLAKVEAAATQYGTSIKGEAAGFAGLAAAQMSGFGVYMLGSTLLGALNSALGLGLGFGAFTGLSSAISVLIGPVGWAALGLYTIKKLGGPNYKKLLPAVILVAVERAAMTNALPPPDVMPRLAGEKLRRIKITCRCGQAIIAEVSNTSSVPSVQCRNCGQQYQINNGALQRLSSTGTHEKLTGATNKSAVQPELATGQVPRAFAPENNGRNRARRYSKAEKTAFQLRPENRELCEITKEFYPGEHFLDLPEDERQVIRDLMGEREHSNSDYSVSTQSSISPDQKQARKERRRQEAEVRAEKRERQRVQAANDRRAKDYSRLLRNLELHPQVIERMALLSNAGVSSQIEDKLGQMNIGHVVYRDSIHGTDPIIYETRVGYDYRIYYRRDGPKIHILLIGDKGSQDADLAHLRRRSNA